MHSDTQAYAGRLKKARELSRQAADVAKRNDQKETTALWLLNAALREAEVGNSAQAREQVTSAMALASTRDLQILAALALARAGDITRAQTMADDLGKRSPLNTVLNGYWLPTIRAAIELNRKHPDKAVELLKAASAYELGQPNPLGGSLYPVYVRGEAYLKAGEGQQAAAEFQKLIDHRSIVQNFVLGALAHLQLGRAKAMSGDKEGARKAYQDFLDSLERRRPRHPHPERSQGGVREAAMRHASCLVAVLLQALSRVSLVGCCYRSHYSGPTGPRQRVSSYLPTVDRCSNPQASSVLRSVVYERIHPIEFVQRFIEKSADELGLGTYGTASIDKLRSTSAASDLPASVQLEADPPTIDSGDS